MRTLSFTAVFVTAGIFGFCGWYYLKNATGLAEDVAISERSPRTLLSYLLPVARYKRKTFVLQVRLIGCCALATSLVLLCLAVRILIYGES
jgi:hypothetical protein